ncbi:MAG: hypothetical protein Q9218_005413 [Villophora microphyllina]
MSVRIALDNSQPTLYTNLDFISGKAILSLRSHETIAAITVKLEGESKSRLIGDLQLPQGYGGFHRRREDMTVETEVHKVLYKAVTVFPTDDLRHATQGSVYTLPPGQHEFSFKFKLPFNNSCADRQSTFVNIAGLQMQAPGNTDRHVRQTLPPSLHRFEDQAVIRYFVKATVQRPAFYKENFRAFFPIEPPRPKPENRESFARIQHQFAPVTDTPATAKSPYFPRKASAPKYDTPIIAPPTVRIDARLPHPAIITCHETLPLKVLVSKLNASPAAIYLQLLQVELVAHTNVRAHHLARESLTSTIITSKSNMKMRLPDKDGHMEIDKGLWKDIPLPSTVAPSFHTCNISRSYSLHVKVGLLHGYGDQVFPELTVQTLRMPLSVYSGIAPPPALLRAMSGSTGIPPISTSNIPPHSPAPFTPQADHHPPIIHSQTPIGTGQTHPEEPFHEAPPVGPSQQPTGPEGPFPDMPPPTYQEAIAEGIGPVGGPRGVYDGGSEAGNGSGAGGSGTGSRVGEGRSGV